MTTTLEILKDIAAGKFGTYQLQGGVTLETISKDTSCKFVIPGICHGNSYITNAILGTETTLWTLLSENDIAVNAEYPIPPSSGIKHIQIGDDLSQNGYYHVNEAGGGDPLEMLVVVNGKVEVRIPFGLSE